MRRSLIAFATLATLLGGAGTGAAQAGGYYQPAQYYGAPYGAPGAYGEDRWERRQAWRQWRHQQDEMRIQDAARREAWRIQQEREQRRAWWQAQHGYGYGYGGGYGRGW